MITTLRRLFASKLGVAIAISFIALMGLGFALSDVNNFSTSSGVSQGNVARVGKKQISIRDVTQRLDADFERAQQQQPGLTKAQFIAGGGLDRVVRQLTEIAALEQYARAHGIAIDDAMIKADIARNPAFAGVDGSFSEEAYRAALARVGTNERQMMADMQSGMIVRQLLAPVGIVRQVPRNLAEPYASLLLEQRQGQAMVIPASRFAPTTPPTEAQLTAFYTAQRARYTIPERRAIRFAMLDESALPVIAEPTAQEIAADYQANAARYAASETRTFSQVIAGTKAVADRIAAGARSGSLDAAASAAGLSVSTAVSANQSQFAAGSNAALARAAFTAAEGELVGPVQVPLGFAVLQVTAIDRKPAQSLAQVSAEIAAALRTRKRQEAMVDLYNGAQDALNGGASVAEVAQEKNLRVVTTPPLLPNGSAPDQPAYRADPLLPQLLGPAFQAVEGASGQIITVVENKVFALVDVARIVPAAPPPLASTKDRVIADWRLQEGSRIARTKARQILAAVDKGQSLSAAATAAGVPGAPQTIDGQRINISNGGQGVPPAIALLFSMSQGSAKTLELPGNQGWAVIHLVRTIRGDASQQPELIGQVQQQFGSALGDEYIGILVAAARRDYPINIDRAAVARLRAELSGTAPASPAAL